MARGNQGERIFVDELDRKRWLETLGETCEKTGWRIHAYVLMGNHYHLLLETERVMGNLGLAPKQRHGYEAYMEGRALELRIKEGRKDLEEQWRAIRRGWYLGGEGFRGRLLKRVEQMLGAGRQVPYSGGAQREHAEQEAQRLLAEGMRALEVGETQLARGAKGMVEKQVLAWWLSQRTAVSRRWVSQRLRMGDESRVTQSIRAVKAGRRGRIAKLRSRLERFGGKEEGQAK
jgi:REP element-mobilizing transposase RayT